jgi:glycosyltransferase involved in cell wall biosynthesis
MRIMMVSVSFGGPTIHVGGEELHVRSLSEALTGRGHSTALLTFRSEHFPVQFPGIAATFSTRSLFPPLLNKVLQIDPLVCIDTLHAFKAWRPDIVHLHAFFHLSFAPIPAAAHLKIPVVATLHSYWPVCLRHRLCYNEDGSRQQRYNREVCAPCLARGLKDNIGVGFPVPLVSLVLRGAWRARRHVLQNVARFIAPSTAIARSLKDSGFPADRIVIIPHGLPQGDFVVRPQQPISEPRGVHLLCVGRLVPNKGVQYLLEALLQVRQVQPDVILTVAGDGAHRPELERLCASLGLTATVRFIGAQSRSALSDLYAKADLMVFPSLSEVFPYVALEAAATGIPVVATTVGGIPEILGDGAILVPPMDTGALARGILAALSDPAAAAARAKLAKERYQTHFGFETMVNRTEAVYRELLNPKVEGTQVGSVR